MINYICHLLIIPLNKNGFIEKTSFALISIKASAETLNRYSLRQRKQLSYYVVGYYLMKFEPTIS